MGDALTAVAAAALALRARVAPHVPRGPGRRDHPLAAAAPARRLRIGSGRALARPQPGATMTTANRHLADHHPAA